MKKTVLITSIVLTFSNVLFAQNQSGTKRFSPASSVPNLSIQHSRLSAEKNLACGPDTIMYTLLKDLKLQATSGYYSVWNATREAMTQSFTLASPALINGVSFYGSLRNAKHLNHTMSVKAFIYSVDANMMPIAKLDSATITGVDTSTHWRTINFPTPYNISSNYAVAIWNPSTVDTLNIWTNNADTGTFGEGLGYSKFDAGDGAGSVFHTMNSAFGGTYDFEPLIAPIVKYNIATNFTVTPNPVCLGQPISLTNITTPVDIVESRFYNYNTFMSYFNLSSVDSNYVWSMGDGSALQWSHDIASYTYANAGNDTIRLYTLGGFFSSCVDSKLIPVTVIGNAVASYTYDGSASPTVAFTNNSTDATTYSWDFGDGVGSSTATSPSYTYPPSGGTYNVVLTATNSCGTNQSTQVVTIISTGINNNSIDAIINIYPNPSTGLFKITNSSNSKILVEVYNVIGEIVFSKEITSQNSTLDLSSFNAGVYSMKITGNMNTIFKKLLIDK